MACAQALGAELTWGQWRPCRGACTPQQTGIQQSLWRLKLGDARSVLLHLGNGCTALFSRLWRRCEVTHRVGHQAHHGIVAGVAAIRAAAVAATADSHVPLPLFSCLVAAAQQRWCALTRCQQMIGWQQATASSVARNSEMQRRRSVSQTYTQDASDTSALHYQDNTAGSIYSVRSKSYHSFPVSHTAMHNNLSHNGHQVGHCSHTESCTRAEVHGPYTVQVSVP